MTKQKYTNGNPDSRGPSTTKLPSHIKLYRHEDRWQTPEGHNPYTEITEEEASEQFPDQYKSLKTYIHLKKELGTKTPMKKVKGVAFYPKQDPTLNSPTVIDTDYDVIVLPNYKISKTMKTKDEHGNVVTQKVHPSKQQLFKRISQTISIEHEVAHSEEQGGSSEDPVSVWERTHKGTKAEALKKYHECSKESEADKKETKFIKDIDKLYHKNPDNPSLKYLKS